MTKRYYYTDPIKALYMGERFGVYLERNNSYMMADIEEQEYGIYYVAKRSEAIFEPKEGDMITHMDNQEGDLEGGGYILEKGDIHCNWLEQFFDKIIMRDNKHFFMPEVKELT
jgi:hypothetical protein